MPHSREGAETRSHFNARLFDFLGFRIAGDIGAYSTYTDRYVRKVVYYYTPPSKPPTPAQVAQRTRFANAHAAWKALTDQQKLDLENASRALSLRITGKNLFMSAALTNKISQYSTVARQCGIDLPPVTYIPYP